MEGRVDPGGLQPAQAYEGEGHNADEDIYDSLIHLW